MHLATRNFFSKCTVLIIEERMTHYLICLICFITLFSILSKIVWIYIYIYIYIHAYITTYTYNNTLIAVVIHSLHIKHIICYKHKYKLWLPVYIMCCVVHFPHIGMYLIEFIK